MWLKIVGNIHILRLRVIGVIMGRKALIGAMTTVAVIGSVLGSSFNSANADSCTYTFQAPVSETHEIDVPEFRFKFEIPANYRSQKNKVINQFLTKLFQLLNFIKISLVSLLNTGIVDSISCICVRCDPTNH